MAQAKRKKRFFNVEMPLIRRTTQLQAYEAKELENRFIKYDLTRIFKGKSMVLTLKTTVKEKEITSSGYELRLMPFYLKRMVRRGTNYIEDSFSSPTKDGKITIKPFLITRRKVSRAVRKALRNEARKELELWAKENTNETLFEEALKNKIQKELSIRLKKIYPLALCELRVLKIVNIKQK